MSKEILQYHQTERYHSKAAGKVTQKAISVKLDYTAAAAIEAEVRCTGVSRNRLINMAIVWYLAQLDVARFESTRQAL